MNPAAGNPSTAEQSPPSLSPLMLVVEDQSDIRYMFTVIFARHFRFIEAADGAEGFKLAASLRPDLIVTDIRMPVMTGEKLVDEVRGDPRLQEIPILVITGCQNFHVQRRIAQKVTVNIGFLEKPFSVQELFAAVERVLKRNFTRRIEP